MSTHVPRLIFWETTAGCNLRCVHCRRVELADQLMADDLTTSESKEWIDQLAAWTRPILVLSGGEPLFRPDIFEIARHASERGLRVALATNGTLIDAGRARQLVEARVQRVAVSLDGADAARHDAFRALPGSFERAIAGLEALRAAGMDTQINTTVARHNLDQLPAMIDLACQVGAKAFHIFLLVPVGCGLEIAQDQMIAPDEYEHVLDWLWEQEQRDVLEIKATCAPHYYRLVRQRTAALHRQGKQPVVSPPNRAQAASGHGGGMHAHTKGCLAGTGVCFVAHQGQVFPCGYLPVEAGDIRRQSLRDIWENSPVFADLRQPDLLEGKCGRCEFVRVCSGCRARAYGLTGNYLGEEPFCVYQPRRSSAQIYT
jgi:heme b synthase